MSLRILQMSVVQERDVVAARQRARQISAMFELSGQDQTRVATTVSELARNALIYAGEGKVEFVLEGDSSPQVLQITISDRGPGIPNLQEVLSGQYKSTTGMGLGVLSAHRLMDRCEITTSGAGTRIVLKKLLPRGAPLVDARQLGSMSAALATLPGDLMLSELQQQNQELLAMLAEQKARQEELLQLTRELEDTNRGVVALYAELDTQAQHLQRATELKSRFLAYMSHEFRTPISALRSLARLLLDGVDGPLTDGQAKQVGFIMSTAEEFADMVNDLLDLAKVEAGRVDISPAWFEMVDLFTALRGMFRPVVTNPDVSLVFEAPQHASRLYTDNKMLSQILRNFISNALKFTVRGEVRVSARTNADQTITFAVADSGIGIEAKFHAAIFEDFTQVDSPIQKRLRGTGLGLSLSRQLAELLGGTVGLRSELGTGSTFFVTIPLQLEAAGRATPGEAPGHD